MGDRDSNREPNIQPGQIWLIEHQGAELCPLDRAALTEANVVLYDPALAGFVAEILPLGSYAEPLSPDTRGAGPAISARALDFAAQGWSVVQLVAAGPDWRAGAQGTGDAFRSASAAGWTTVRVIAKAAGCAYRSRDGRLPNLSALIEGLSGDDPLTLVLGNFAPPAPVEGRAFTANGLAG